MSSPLMQHGFAHGWWMMRWVVECTDRESNGLHKIKGDKLREDADIVATPLVA